MQALILQRVKIPIVFVVGWSILRMQEYIKK